MADAREPARRPAARSARSARWGAGPDNPRRYPARHPATVELEVASAEAQRAELEALAARTGQAGALAIGVAAVRPSPTRGAFSWSAWTESVICVLPSVDVVVLFPQPATVVDAPVPVAARWDVVERVCGTTCWDELPDAVPRRVVTRRWPSPAQLAVVRGLALPDLPAD